MAEPRPDSAPACEYLNVHEDAVAQVLAALPDDETLYDLSELFRVFGDSTRIKILYVLFESELCVCDIARLLKLKLYELEEETLLTLQPLLSSPDISALEQAVARHRQERR